MSNVKTWPKILFNAIKGIIIVNKIGNNTFNEVIDGLQQFKRERKDAIYLFMPLGVKASPYIVENCEKAGFSFAGIMPHIHNGDDRILMQYISVPLNTDNIRVYGKKSTKLFSYIINEQKRVDNNFESYVLKWYLRYNLIGYNIYIFGENGG